MHGRDIVLQEGINNMTKREYCAKCGEELISWLEKRRFGGQIFCDRCFQVLTKKETEFKKLIKEQAELKKLIPERIKEIKETLQKLQEETGKEVERLKESILHKAYGGKK